MLIKLHLLPCGFSAGIYQCLVLSALALWTVFFFPFKSKKADWCSPTLLPVLHSFPSILPVGVLVPPHGLSIKYLGHSSLLQWPRLCCRDTDLPYLKAGTGDLLWSDSATCSPHGSCLSRKLLVWAFGRSRGTRKGCWWCYSLAPTTFHSIPLPKMKSRPWPCIECPSALPTLGPVSLPPPSCTQCSRRAVSLGTLRTFMFPRCLLC